MYSVKSVINKAIQTRTIDRDVFEQAFLICRNSTPSSSEQYLRLERTIDGVRTIIESREDWEREGLEQIIKSYRVLPKWEPATPENLAEWCYYSADDIASLPCYQDWRESAKAAIVRLTRDRAKQGLKTRISDAAAATGLRPVDVRWLVEEIAAND